MMDKFQIILLVGLVSLMIIVAGCGLAPGQSIAGEAVRRGDFSTVEKVQPIQRDVTKVSTVENSLQNKPVLNKEGCPKFHFLGDVYISGNGKGTDWTYCKGGSNDDICKAEWYYHNFNHNTYGYIEASDYSHDNHMAAFQGCTDVQNDDSNEQPWCATKTVKQCIRGNFTCINDKYGEYQQQQSTNEFNKACGYTDNTCIEGKGCVPKECLEQSGTCKNENEAKITVKNTCNGQVRTKTINCGKQKNDLGQPFKCKSGSCSI